MVNISGNAVAMPWVNEVPAIVQGWFLGSEAGTALASVLVGDANPSGKLPFTFPAKLEDVGLINWANIRAIRKNWHSLNIEEIRLMKSIGKIFL